MAKDARREPRYRVQQPEKISATIRRGEEEESATLLDLSHRGARLRVSSNFNKGDLIELYIAAEDAEFETSLTGTVCWVEADRDGWAMGCTVRPQLPEELLNDLALSGLMERRQDSRRSISFEAEAKIPFNPDFQPIKIVNMSAGGFCAISKQPIVSVNDPLLIRLDKNEANDDTHLVKVRVAWARETEDRQTIGCNFTSKADFAKLQAVADPDRVGNPLFHLLDQANRPPRWSVVATGLMFLIVLISALWSRIL